MVHVLSRSPSVGYSLGQALGGALTGYLGHLQQKQQQNQLQQALDEAQGLYSNPDLSPEQRQIGLFKSLRAHPEIAINLGRQLSGIQGQQQRTQQDFAQDEQRYNVIRKNFGERAAELYRAAPEGGKTHFLGALLESRQRGMDVEEFLGQQPEMNQSLERGVNGQPAAMLEKPIERDAIKAIDYDKGLLPKERIRRQEERYGKNLPLYQEATKKLQGIEAEKDSLDTLEELSTKIGTLTRLNINPSTGELLIPALASPEAQRYVKTVNDFTTKAKDSYGARVSNFELDRFMKRLPTLANSQEGRRQIIRQMQIINDINGAREKALQDIIEEHGGIRNIDYDQAEKMADKYARPRIESLRKEFRTIDNDLEKQYEKKTKEQKVKVPNGFVGVQKADGTQGYIPKEKLKAFLKIKGNKVL